MFRTNVNEMNVQPIDLGDEIRQGVQSCLALAPVVVRAPIARECLTGRELYALRCVRDRFPFRPLCRVYTPAQFGKFCFRKIHIKWTKCICLLAASLCSTGLGHGVLLLSSLDSSVYGPGDYCFYVPRRTSSIDEWERRYHKTDAGSIKPRQVLALSHQYETQQFKNRRFRVRIARHLGHSCADEALLASTASEHTRTPRCPPHRRFFSPSHK